MKLKQRRRISNGFITTILVAGIIFFAFYIVTSQNSNLSTTTSLSTISTSTTTSSVTTTSNQCAVLTACGTFGSSTGIIIPLYVNPSSAQFIEYSQEMIQMREAYPTVPVVVIINPDSGVGTYNPTVLTEVEAMQAVGINVVGYDWTGYCQFYIPYTAGGNPYLTTADIDNNMSDYAAWYHVNGIFFDGMQYGGLCAPVYTEFTQYANNLGMRYTFGNPGTMTIPQYVGTVTSIFVYEGGYAPTISTFSASWTAGEPKSNFEYIGFNQITISLSYIQTASQYVQWIYMTNDNGCSWDGSTPVYTSTGAYNNCALGPVNPYSTLPAHLSTEMQDLATVAAQQ